MKPVKVLALFLGLVVLVGGLVVACGTASDTSCNSSLPCSVSTNIN
jgi:hypothetical protein